MYLSIDPTASAWTDETPLEFFRWQLQWARTKFTEWSYKCYRLVMLVNKVIEMLSYSTSLCTIKSATPAASANVGMSRPIWLNVKAMFFPTARASYPFDSLGDVVDIR